MSFSMEVPDLNAIQNKVEEEVKPTSQEEIKLQELAEKNVSELLKVDLDSLSDKKVILKTIDDFGIKTMERSSKKNSLLSVSIQKLSASGNEGHLVADGLSRLQQEMKGLDPSGIDFTKKGLLGVIFNPLKSYFAKYQKADGVIANIIETIENGKEILKNDITTLEIEKSALRELTKQLSKEIKLASLMDANIENQIELAKARVEDEEKIKFISEEVLFPLRQKVLDMQTMIAVNNQGIIAMEMVIRNNKELIRGVDRARTVTMSALNTAVMVASATCNQKLVLNSIQALNTTTAEFIKSTSKMIQQQGIEIQKQSIEACIPADIIMEALNNVITAVEDYNTYKIQSLPVMKQVINKFGELSEVGEKVILRLEKGNSLGLT